MEQPVPRGKRADNRWFGAVGRRLLAARWFLVALVVPMAAAIAFGGISFGAAVALYAATALVALLLPRAAPLHTISPSLPPADPARPDGGITRLAEALPEPTIILDRRCVVQYANRRAVDIFAIRPGDPLTFRLRVPDLLAAFERVSRDGQPERVEFVERIPTERWYSAWFARIDDGPSPGNLIALVIDDLTQHRQIDRIRVDFVANASHELRTPLASLVGFIETLQGPARDDPAARERFLDIMREQATRMSRLIDDLLSLSRIEMKAHVRPSATVDLVTVVRHVVDAMEPRAGALGVRIEAALPAEPAIVIGDRDELIRVVENLVENACKYGQSGERVEVGVQGAGEGHGPVLTVRDHGPGIPAEHIPRLTERFYRVEVAESRKHRGTGLGLAIVKHTLARHRARLTIESQRGEGALFSVTFPPPIVTAPSLTEENSVYISNN